MSGLRLALVALLAASTALFAAGVLAERAQTDGHAEPASVHARESGEAAGTGEGQPSSAHGGEHETVLGIDIESTPLIVLAAIAGLALAALVAAPLGRRPAVLLAIAAIAVAWAALDVREVVHQSNESRSGLAIVASAVALLHLAAAAAAALLAGRERGDIGSPDHAGTMPA